MAEALRKTATRLEDGGYYAWGHMGGCNCGNLAQTITRLSKAEIHAYAMQRYGDWREQLLEFCPSSGYPLDLVIEKLVEYGFTVKELKKLETLSDPKVIAVLPDGRNELSRNSREDAVLYMRTWADVLEAELGFEELKQAAQPKPVLTEEQELV